MKRLIAPLTMIVADSIKAFFFMLAVISVTYADTNSFDESPEISTKYITGDLVSAEGGLQAEVLENTENSIEIGLFNQEDQITAILMWNVKSETGSVILNPDTEDEETLPIQITEQMNPENRMETLADGLRIMAVAPTSEPLSSEERKLRSANTKNSRVIKAASAPIINTEGFMYVNFDKFPIKYTKRLQDNVKNYLYGSVRSYTRVSGGSDERPVWIRFMAFNHSLAKWEVMGWLRVAPPFHLGIFDFAFAIPEPYDLDRTGNDLGTAAFSRQWLSKLPFPGAPSYPAYLRRYTADAWIGPGKHQRRTFMTTEHTVIDVPE